MTLIQRFGSALNLNVHFHMLVLDGVYRRDVAQGRLRFVPVPAPSTEERLYGSTIQYAFFSTLSWSNLIQYDNISENLGLNTRLHWIPRAGQQAFVVLNWGAIDPDKDNSFVSTFADLSLKFNYTFRF